jgi:hypothetical protein
MPLRMPLGQVSMADSERHRFAVSSPNDQQAWIWVFSLLSLIYSVSILGVRTLVKLGRGGADDIALVIAYVSSACARTSSMGVETDGRMRTGA